MKKAAVYSLFCIVIAVVVAVIRKGNTFAFIAADALTVSGGLIGAVSALSYFLSSDYADGAAYALRLRLGAVFPSSFPPSYEKFKAERREKRRKSEIDGLWFGSVLFGVGVCFLPFFL